MNQVRSSEKFLHQTKQLIQPQFLCQDTYGSVRPGLGPDNTGDLTAYQLLYNVAAEVRAHYLDGCNPDSSPVSVTSAQCVYQGVERDASGREGHSFTLLNVDVTGHNTMLEEPFSLVGHAVSLHCVSILATAQMRNKEKEETKTIVRTDGRA
jgi:hypothetical protein